MRAGLVHGHATWLGYSGNAYLITATGHSLFLFTPRFPDGFNKIGFDRPGA